MVLKNFSQSTCQLDPLALPAVEYLLRELERDKYRVCSGAFTEVTSIGYNLLSFCLFIPFVGFLLLQVRVFSLFLSLPLSSLSISLSRARAGCYFRALDSEGEKLPA